MVITIYLFTAVVALLSAFLFQGNFIVSILVAVLALLALVFDKFILKRISALAHVSRWIRIALVAVILLGSLFVGIRVNKEGPYAYARQLDKVYDAFDEEDGYKAGQLLDAIDSEYENYSSFIFARAKAAYLREELNEAQRWLERLDSSDKQSEDYYSLASAVYLDQGELEEAEELFIEAAIRYPQWTMMQYFAGAQAVENGHYDVGAYFLERAAYQDNGKSALPSYFLGVAMYEKGYYERAMEYFEEAKSITDDEELLGNMKWYIEKMEESGAVL